MVVAVPTLPSSDAWNIDLQTQNDVSFAVLENTFGDGYIQRATDGLNSNRDTWQATYTNLKHDEAKILMDFFEERAGWQPFYWQAPGDSDVKQWTARDLKRQPTGVSGDLAYWKITVTFKEEFGGTIEVIQPFFVEGVEATGGVGRIVGNSPTVLLHGAVGTGHAGRVMPSTLVIVGVYGTGLAGDLHGGISHLSGVKADGIAVAIGVSIT